MYPVIYKMNMAINTRSLWKDKSDDSNTFLLYRSPDDKDPLELNVNDFIRFDGRSEGAKIVKILGTKEEEGPRGFSYLPWRETESRWATPAFSLRGDPRYIICYPAGFPHCGQHVLLHTITTHTLPQKQS